MAGRSLDGTCVIPKEDTWRQMYNPVYSQCPRGVSECEYQAFIYYRANIMGFLKNSVLNAVILFEEPTGEKGL